MLVLRYGQAMGIVSRDVHLRMRYRIDGGDEQVEKLVRVLHELMLIDRISSYSLARSQTSTELALELELESEILKPQSPNRRWELKRELKLLDRIDETGCSVSSIPR